MTFTNPNIDSDRVLAISIDRMIARYAKPLPARPDARGVGIDELAEFVGSRKARRWSDPNYPTNDERVV